MSWAIPRVLILLLLRTTSFPYLRRFLIGFKSKLFIFYFLLYHKYICSHFIFTHSKFIHPSPQVNFHFLLSYFPMLDMVGVLSLDTSSDYELELRFNNRKRSGTHSNSRPPLTKDILDEFRITYSIPDTKQLRLPLFGERANVPPPGEMSVYTTMFKYGVRLPLSPFFLGLFIVRGSSSYADSTQYLEFGYQVYYFMESIIRPRSHDRWTFYVTPHFKKISWYPPCLFTWVPALAVNQ